MFYPVSGNGIKGIRRIPLLATAALFLLLTPGKPGMTQTNDPTTCPACPSQTASPTSCTKCRNGRTGAVSPSRHYVQAEKKDFLSMAFPTLYGPDSVLTSPEQKERQQQLRQQQIQAQQLRTQQIRQQQIARQQLALQGQQARPNAVPATASANPWYDPLGLLTSSSPPAASAVSAAAVSRSGRPTPPQRPVNTVNSSPVQRIQATGATETRPIIAQASYRAPRNTAATAGTASPELHKPWDVDEIIRRKPVAGAPYRLVSDTQAARTSPPPSNLDRLVAAPTPSNTRQATPTQREPMPIFGIGRDFMKEFRPSNDRTWSQNHAVLQTAEFNGNTVTVRNVRYSKYVSREEYSTTYYDATFNLDEIRSIDLVIVPFQAMPSLAHVQASFGFADGRHLGMSIEARYEEGEQYDPVAASIRQFELIYVFADERDLIRIGTDVNKNDVHIYRLKFEPNEVREMFVDALQRANGLAKKPEFYHPLRNSCVTNLIAHINKGRPKAIPKEYRTLLPGLMDNYVFDLKLVDTTAKTFKEAKENAKVNWLVEKYGDLEYFSAGIRQNMY